ncbi:uncharacterized protein JCM15063_004459 [Sporobolomyces koalae]|uniref:uncharacterized protein n=1 Tax=Sporobolomyces koalae TaxID=500713 RepID=UPI00317E4326
MTRFTARPPLWSIPISKRDSRVPLVHASLFTIVFNSLILSVFVLLVLLLPLQFISNRTKNWHRKFGKGLFGQALVLINEWFFRDLEFVVSAQGPDGQDLQIDQFVERDQQGKLDRIKVPAETVWVANHQTLADWLYIWQFLYLVNHHSNVYIALKSSLRKIPIIGQACQWFGFAFLERNWLKDRRGFGNDLKGMVDVSGTTRDGFDFLLFPEGTIVTENTRGISTRFAQKSGIKDLEYTLLPRSTGLFFALQRLSIERPNLVLTDLTVGYPLPSSGATATSKEPVYPSQHYSLPSIFLQGIAPPELHFHLRFFKVSEIPLGDLTRVTNEDGDKEQEQDRQAFEQWLLARWTEKDELLKRFNSTGTFTASAHDADESDSDSSELEQEGQGRFKGEVRWIPNSRKTFKETAECFGYGIPLITLGWILPLAVRGVLRSWFGGSKPTASGCSCGKMSMGSSVDRLEL